MDLTLISIKVAQSPVVIFEMQNKLNIIIKSQKSNGQVNSFFQTKPFIPAGTVVPPQEGPLPTLGW